MRSRSWSYFSQQQQQQQQQTSAQPTAAAEDAHDTIGVSGENPGECWHDPATAACITKDVTLTRKYSVVRGQATWDATQWNVFNGNDEYLGSHSARWQYLRAGPVEDRFVRECYACPRGQFAGAGAFGENKSNKCHKCANGTYASNAGSTSCARCAQGKRSAGDNTFCEWEQNTTLQTACPLGTFISAESPTWLDAGATPACAGCRPGRIGIKAPGLHDGEEEACALCGVGFHAPIYGSTRCQPCPLGTFGTLTIVQLSRVLYCADVLRCCPLSITRGVAQPLAPATLGDSCK